MRIGQPITKEAVLSELQKLDFAFTDLNQRVITDDQISMLEAVEPNKEIVSERKRPEIKEPELVLIETTRLLDFLKVLKKLKVGYVGIKVKTDMPIELNAKLEEVITNLITSEGTTLNLNYWIAPRIEYTELPKTEPEEVKDDTEVEKELKSEVV